jgi:hypothetical protein
MEERGADLGQLGVEGAEEVQERGPRGGVDAVQRAVGGLASELHPAARLEHA